ncbi:MAG: hypothetical protein ACE3L7_02530 [Candidatus Pristimantibacillus sp.]
MNKKLILVTTILTFSLLSACQNPSESTSGSENAHASHNQENTDKSDEHHAGKEQLNATFSFDKGTAAAEEDTELTILVSGKDGAPVNEFDENHEKLLHLIIVNHDLSFFNHIHPEFQGEGKFTVTTSFPAGGDYKLFADFIPAGGSSTTLSEWVKVDGTEAEHNAVMADAKLTKEVDGKIVDLNLSSMKANEEVNLTFNIRDAKTNKGVDTLEQYLGAVGHVVILSDDAEQYLHVHPIDEKATGPEARFATSFPHSGTYKIWGQFQHNGEVFTVPFVVDIK